jgi:hypothetical protein
MKFKILKGTDTFKKLQLLLDEIKKANQAAKELAEELGCSHFSNSAGHYILAGGLFRFAFKTPPGKDWRKSYITGGQQTYQPAVTKNTIELRERISALPLVYTEHLNKIIGYEEQDIPASGRTIWSTHPTIHPKDNLFLLSMHENSRYTPPTPDIIEITMSEYKTLLADEKDKEPAAVG